MQLPQLLQHINERHNATFAFVNRYTTGEQGAYAITDCEGRQYVLKWRTGTHHVDQLRYAGNVTNRLRAAGYPAPEYLYIGTAFDSTYYIQTTLPGVPMRRLTPHYLPQALKLNELQMGQAPGSSPDDWRQVLINCVLYGGDGFCLHSSLQQHSPETAQLLYTLQNIVLAHQDELPIAGDIVHVDFNPANLLISNEAISGVVDCDGVCAGDCSFDLATLLFYAYGDASLREQLWHHLLARTSRTIVSVYLAHLILRQTDWSLRFHDATTSNHYLAMSFEILKDIS